MLAEENAFSVQEADCIDFGEEGEACELSAASLECYYFLHNHSLNCLSTRVFEVD